MENYQCVWVPCSCSAFDNCSRCGGRGGNYVKAPGTVEEPASHLDKHPRRQELLDKGKQAFFYGISVEDLTRDELIMLIGYLGEENRRDREFRQKERELMETFAKAR